MRIKTRLSVTAFVIAALSVMIVAGVLTWTASTQVERGLLQARSDQMTSLKNVTTNAIKQYGRNLQNQLLYMASQETVIEAVKGMGGSFGAYSLFAGEKKVPQHRETVRSYYRSDYLEQFQAINSASSPNVDQWAESLTDNAVTLQSHFIATNPAGDDLRFLLDEVSVSSSYNNFHKRYQPYFRRFQTQMGLDDILLYEPERGAIVYSVQKDIDFGVSLEHSLLQDTPLARAVRQAMEREPGEFVFSDFAPYRPALNQPRAFLATPVADEEGTVLGVLAFRISPDQLNSLVSYDYNWQASGLGKTGSTYLVGPDGLARSNSRILLQEPEAFRRRMEGTGADAETVDTIVAMNTNVGRQNLRTPVVDRALDGQSGTEVVTNIWGDKVISSYAPVEMLGVPWAVISDIQRDEALANVAHLNRTIQLIAMVTAIVLAGIGAIAGLWIARTMTRPVNQTVRTLNAIAAGDGDLTQLLDEHRQDELGDLARAFNRFVQKIHGIVVHVKDVNAHLVKTTSDVQSHSHQALQSLADQHLQTDQVSTAMTEMAASMQDVAQHASQAEQQSQEAENLASAGVEEVNELAETVRRMNQQTETAAHSIRKLSEQSDSIGTILDVIRSIAEQINLLALNAAIEAARAGEHGRGFAVVADEVRTLASRTQQSTEEIQGMIEALQDGSKNVVNAMETGRSAVILGVEQADSARDTLSRIADANSRIREANLSIASTVEEQSHVGNDINQSMLQIKAVTEHTSQGSEAIGKSVAELGELNDQLQRLVGRFRVDAERESQD